MPKKSPSQMLENINHILQQYKQTIRVVEWFADKIVLSNGDILYHNERLRFIRRVVNNKTTLWAEHMDDLISGKLHDGYIISKLNSIGGIAVQKTHGELIKSNLNTGTPWSLGKRFRWKTGGHTASAKEKIRQTKIGKLNGMYGKHHTELYKHEQSVRVKTRILNGTFTPNSNNRNTHWKSTFIDKKYRSSWEALYQYINPTAQYEKLRIPYIYRDKMHVYIVDFIDYVNNFVIEIKPHALMHDEKTTAKLLALNNWAHNNNFEVLIIDEYWFLSNKTDIDYSLFDNKTATKIRGLYETSIKNRN